MTTWSPSRWCLSLDLLVLVLVFVGFVIAGARLYEGIVR